MFPNVNYFPAYMNEFSSLSAEYLRADLVKDVKIHLNDNTNLYNE